MVRELDQNFTFKRVGAVASQMPSSPRNCLAARGEFTSLFLCGPLSTKWQPLFEKEDFIDADDDDSVRGFFFEAGFMQSGVIMPRVPPWRPLK